MPEELSLVATDAVVFCFQTFVANNPVHKEHPPQSCMYESTNLSDSSSRTEDSHEVFEHKLFKIFASMGPQVAFLSHALQQNRGVEGVLGDRLPGVSPARASAVTH